MKKVMEIEKVFEKVEKQDGKPFVGAKVFEYMEDYTSHTQGDVEVIKVPSVPKNLKPFVGFNGILAEGLANSGRHRILDKDMASIEAFKFGEEYDGPMLVASKAWTLTHPNHKWATFPAGCYQVKFPREMHLGEMRKQQD